VNAVTADPADRRLAALGIERLRLRVRGAAPRPAPSPATLAVAAPAAAIVAAEVTSGIRRLALSVDTGELADPVLREMYAALTKAVGQVGLQCVRVCDVAADPAAVVMVFGTAPVPVDVPALRVLRVDPLAVLHADRARKRVFWDRLQRLGREGRG
jgi:hypothetical protein